MLQHMQPDTFDALRSKNFLVSPAQYPRPGPLPAARFKQKCRLWFHCNKLSGGCYCGGCNNTPIACSVSCLSYGKRGNNKHRLGQLLCMWCVYLKFLHWRRSSASVPVSGSLRYMFYFGKFHQILWSW